MVVLVPSSWCGAAVGTGPLAPPAGPSYDDHSI